VALEIPWLRSVVFSFRKNLEDERSYIYFCKYGACAEDKHAMRSSYIQTSGAYGRGKA